MLNGYTALLIVKQACLQNAKTKLKGKRRSAHINEVDALVDECLKPLSIISEYQREVACHSFIQELDEKVYDRKFSAKTLALLKRIGIGAHE
tara:strand:+ start:6210 stop:6485 length:276 start_codon:yes stop_codon:yes gene_type:complete